MFSPLWMQVLKYEVARQPEALGSTVFGYNDAYTSLKPFLQRWRSSAAAQQGPSPPSQQRPYLLSVDITRAFDSIDTELMCWPLLLLCCSAMSTSSSGISRCGALLSSIFV